MSTTVDDLLRASDLGLEPLAGLGGADRTVSWAHTSELADPAQWLEGGELLLNVGMGISDDADDQIAYLRRLNDRRVAAWAIGERHSGTRRRLHASLLAEADRLGFPILAVSDDTPFVQITHFVWDANKDAAQRRLVTQGQVLQALRQRTQGSATIDELVARLEEVAGYRLYALTLAGDPLLQEGRPVPPDAADAFAADPGSFAVPDGWRVPLMVGGRDAGVLVALQRGDREPMGLAAVRHIATVIEVETADLYRQRSNRRRDGAVLLTRLLTGHVPKNAVALLEASGLSSHDEVEVIVVASTADSANGDALHMLLADARVPHLVVAADETVLLVQADGRARALLSRSGYIAGVSSPGTELTGTALKRREAAWALGRAVTSAPGTIVEYASDPVAAHWLPQDLDVLQQLVADVLGPVLDYDETQGTDLIASLRVYFSHDRRLKESADKLFVHKHTLAYRLRRIEKMTGRSLSNVGDTAELWMALCALDVESDPKFST